MRKTIYTDLDTIFGARFERVKFYCHKRYVNKYRNDIRQTWSKREAHTSEQIKHTLPGS